MEDFDAESRLNSGQLLDSPHHRTDEVLPLIKKEISSRRSVLALRYRTTRKCITSKAALLILLWSFAVGISYGLGLNPDNYVQTFSLFSSSVLIVYGGISIVLCFFPLAGLLADIRYGRYKTVICSLHTILPAIILCLVGAGFMFPFIIGKRGDAMVLLFCLGVPILGISGVILFAGFIGFTANAIPFGMDQLHDSPGEDQSLFIHWYVWIYYASLFISQLPWNFNQVYGLSFISYTFGNGTNIGISLSFLLMPLSVFTLLIISLCVARHRRKWFLIEPGRVNPYKLVYRVTKFAFQHRTPVHRSAFTYCEDELPSGLNLGKNKYGGPFTTEEVEDVKAFCGILKVLFSFGTVYFLDYAANSALPLFAGHDIPYHPVNNMSDNHTEFKYDETLLHHIFISNGLVTPLFIIICIPLYLCLIRPFVSHRVPGMLKRMGTGMLLVLFSLIATFTMDTVLHSRNKEVMCMFRDAHEEPPPPPPPYQDTTFLLLQHTLSALSNMLIYIGSFEFICSQSPHSMKGMLIGLWYAIKGLFQLIGTILSIPFFTWKHHGLLFPSCGFVYYLVNTVIGVFALTVYVWVAMKYKKRERDEPCNVRRFAEDYYSNIQGDYD